MSAADDDARLRATSTDDELLVRATAELFALLGDPTRVRLLYALLDRGEQSVGSLADGLGVSDSAVSHALRLLRTSKVVAARREGRTIRYHLDDPHVRELLAVTRQHLLEDLPPRPSSGRDH